MERKSNPYWTQKMRERPETSLAPVPDAPQGPSKAKVLLVMLAIVVVGFFALIVIALIQVSDLSVF